MADTTKFSMLHMLPPELLWDVLMRLDREGLLKLCSLDDDYFDAWCDKNNTFWKARYVQDFAPLDLPTDWKGLWINGVKCLNNNKLYDLNRKALRTSDTALLNSLTKIRSFPMVQITDEMIVEIGENSSYSFITYLVNNIPEAADWLDNLLTGAMQAGRIDVTKFLIEKAAVVNMMNITNLPILKYFYEERNIDFPDYALAQFIETAVRDRNIEMLRYIILDMNISKDTLIDELMVMPAILSKNSDMVDILLEKGFTPSELIEEQIYIGPTPDKINYLLNKGATVDDLRNSVNFEIILELHNNIEMLKYLATLDIYPISSDYDSYIKYTIKAKDFDNFKRILDYYPEGVDNINMSQIIKRGNPFLSYILNAGVYIDPILFGMAKNAEQLHQLIHRQNMTLDDLRPYLRGIMEPILQKKDEEMARVIVAMGLTKDEVHEFVTENKIKRLLNKFDTDDSPWYIGPGYSSASVIPSVNYFTDEWLETWIRVVNEHDPELTPQSKIYIDLDDEDYEEGMYTITIEWFNSDEDIETWSTMVDRDGAINYLRTIVNLPIYDVEMNPVQYSLFPINPFPYFSFTEEVQPPPPNLLAQAQAQGLIQGDVVGDDMADEDLFAMIQQQAEGVEVQEAEPEIPEDVAVIILNPDEVMIERYTQLMEQVTWPVVNHLLFPNQAMVLLNYIDNNIEEPADMALLQHIINMDSQEDFAAFVEEIHFNAPEFLGIGLAQAEDAIPEGVIVDEDMPVGDLAALIEQQGVMDEELDDIVNQDLLIEDRLDRFIELYGNMLEDNEEQVLNIGEQFINALDNIDQDTASAVIGTMPINLDEEEFIQFMDGLPHSLDVYIQQHHLN